jgi:tetratricopeptide (TPR) repeat protein
MSDARLRLVRRLVDAADAGRRAEAARLLGRLEELSPGSAWAGFYRAALALSAGRRADARRALEPLKGAPPESFFIGRHEPEIPSAAAHPRLLGEALLLAARSRAPWAHLLAACCLRDAARREECAAAAARAARLAPRDPAVLAMSARLRYLQRLPPAAVAAMERAARLAPDCYWIAAWMGETRRYQARWRDAEAWLDRALRAEPGYGVAYSWRGAARRRLGRTREALADLDRALAWFARDERHDYYSSAWARHERSLALRELGRLREAIEDLNAAHRISQRYAWWGDPHRRPEPTQSPESLPRSAADGSRDPWVWAWLGRARHAQGRLSEAATALDRALALSRAGAWPLAWRAAVHLEHGHPQRALPLLEKSARRDPRFPTTHLLIGQAEMALGRPRRAERALARSLAGPDLRDLMGLAGQGASGSGPSGQGEALPPGSLVPGSRIQGRAAAASGLMEPAWTRAEASVIMRKGWEERE